MMSHMKIGFLGDTHGNADWVQFALRTFHSLGADKIVQLGDFGIWPNAERFYRKTNLTLANYGQTLYVTPGNHEDYDQIKNLEERLDGWLTLTEHILVATRGLRWQWDDVTFLSLGGAPSVDRAWRVKYMSESDNRESVWWPEEAITPEDEAKAVEGGSADIMVTHDAPNYDMLLKHISGNPMGFTVEDLHYSAEGRKIMDRVVAAVKPRVLLHGHYHKYMAGKIRDTGVIGLSNERSDGAMAILDTETHSLRVLDDVSKEYLNYQSVWT